MRYVTLTLPYDTVPEILLLYTPKLRVENKTVVKLILLFSMQKPSYYLTNSHLTLNFMLLYKTLLNYFNTFCLKTLLFLEETTHFTNHVFIYRKWALIA